MSDKKNPPPPPRRDKTPPSPQAHVPTAASPFLPRALEGFEQKSAFIYSPIMQPATSPAPRAPQQSFVPLEHIKTAVPKEEIAELDSSLLMDEAPVPPTVLSPKPATIPPAKPAAVTPPKPIAVAPPAPKPIDAAQPAPQPVQSAMPPPAPVRQRPALRLVQANAPLKAPTLEEAPIRAVQTAPQQKIAAPKPIAPSKPLIIPPAHSNLPPVQYLRAPLTPPARKPYVAPLPRDISNLLPEGMDVSGVDELLSIPHAPTQPAPAHVAAPAPQTVPFALSEETDALKPASSGLGKKIFGIAGMTVLGAGLLAAIGGVGYFALEVFARRNETKGPESNKTPFGTVSEMGGSDASVDAGADNAPAATAPSQAAMTGNCTKTRPLNEAENVAVGGLVGSRTATVQFCKSAADAGDKGATIRVNGAEGMSSLENSDAFVRGVSHAFVSAGAKPCTPQELATPYVISRDQPLSALCAERQDETVANFHDRFINAKRKMNNNAGFDPAKNQLSNETTVRIVVGKALPQAEKTWMDIKNGKRKDLDAEQPAESTDAPHARHRRHHHP